MIISYCMSVSQLTPFAVAQSFYPTLNPHLHVPSPVLLSESVDPCSCHIALPFPLRLLSQSFIPVPVDSFVRLFEYSPPSLLHHLHHGPLPNHPRPLLLSHLRH